MKKNELFTYTDAWIFLSLCEILYNDSFDFKRFIIIADCFEHAIPNFNELKSSIEKLVRYSLIYFQKNKLYISDKGLELFSKYNKTRGGQFSRVEIMYKKLNSSRNKYIENLNIQKFSFIKEDEYIKLCKSYSKNNN